MRGKLIIIEGTDCSGKETQSKKLIERLTNEGIETIYFGFPAYGTATGNIVGGPYLGKKHICEGWFTEGAANVDPKVASLYYAADRRYHSKHLNEQLDEGINILLDRYTFSNLAHQGGKIFDKNERYKMYDWLDKLEFEMLELPKPDISIFIHMPYEQALILKQNREEGMDQHESNKEHLINAEKAFIEVAERYNFKTFECVINDEIKTIEMISNEIYDYVINEIKDLNN